MSFVIATRKSELALWQARRVAALLAAAGVHDVELLPLSTRGDEVLDRSLAAMGGKGLFLKELEAALLDGRAQIAVHSLKDVPACMDERFQLAAVIERGSPWDAWVSPAFADPDNLPAGARVGTASPRRAAQLRALRPDLQPVTVRGNLQTRLGKLDAGECEGLLLACAGLERLGLGARITARLGPPRWLPAPGQGAIAVQTVAGDHRAAESARAIDDPASHTAVTLERTVAAGLEADCHSALAVHACRSAAGGDDWRLEAAVFAEDGSRRLAAAADGPGDSSQARAVLDDLLRQGAAELI